MQETKRYRYRGQLTGSFSCIAQLQYPVIYSGHGKGIKKLGVAFCLSLYIAMNIWAYSFTRNSLSTVSYYAHELEEYEFAIGLYSRMIQFDKEDAWAYYNRGCAYKIIGESKKSRRDYYRARRLDPSLFEGD